MTPITFCSPIFHIFQEEHASDTPELFRTIGEKDQIKTAVTIFTSKDFKKEMFASVEPKLIGEAVLSYFRTSPLPIIPVDYYEDLIAITLPREEAIDDALLCASVKEKMKLLHPERVRLLERCVSAYYLHVYSSHINLIFFLYTTDYVAAVLH